MSRMIKVGSHEFHVVVDTSDAGGFCYTLVDIDMGGPRISEIRHESELLFDTAEAAYEGGSAHARRSARQYRH